MKYEIANIIFALSMVFNLLFSRSMLNTRETLPSFFKFSNIFILVIAFLVFGSIAFDGILLPAEIVNILYVLTSTIILGLVIFCSYKRDRSGIFLLGSWLMMLIGSFIGMLCIHGLVDENFFTRYAFLFGTGSEGILLSISLADRINVMKKDRERYLVEKSKLESVVDILGILDNIEVKKEGSIKTPHFTDKTMKVIVHRVMSILQQIKDFYALKEERNRYQAIANTVQMLAHDVRKPFIQLEYIIYFLKNEQKNGNGENIYSRFMPMLQNSISYIDGMLIDIMEIGSASKPRLGYCRASDIIKQSILKVFTFELESNIEFRYNFQHTKLLYVQDTKVERAFMNILSNALEAMKKVGDIWIETSDIVVEGKSYISFKIGNSNSYLSEEECSHIFEGFYTSGKRSGFGLGLAIVKKVVDDHGGTISCRSSLELGVEFILTLPSGIKRDNADHFSLPRASKDVFSVWSTQSSECERTKHVIT